MSREITDFKLRRVERLNSNGSRTGLVGFKELRKDDQFKFADDERLWTAESDPYPDKDNPGLLRIKAEGKNP